MSDYEQGVLEALDTLIIQNNHILSLLTKKEGERPDVSSVILSALETQKLLCKIKASGKKTARK
jgi:hypothetical protein